MKIELFALLAMLFGAALIIWINLRKKHRFAEKVEDLQQPASCVDTGVESEQTETLPGANRETRKTSSKPISEVEKIIPSSEEEESDNNDQDIPFSEKSSQALTSNGMESSSFIKNKKILSDPEDLETTEQKYVSLENSSAVEEVGNAVDPDLLVGETSQAKHKDVEVADAIPEIGSDKERKDETLASEVVQRSESEFVRSTATKITSHGDDSLPSASEQLDAERALDEMDHEQKRPRKYTGIDRTPPQPKKIDREKALSIDREPTKRDRSLPIEIRLRFDRDGFCSVSLIAKRSLGLADNLTVSAQWGKVDLRAMQDEWYQDIVPSDLAKVLRQGDVWTQEGENGQCVWSLSGRELYVLASRPDISGYISQACLDLGREHVVLCSEKVRSAVEEAILATGGMPTSILDKAQGAPPGWVVFRKVIPQKPITPLPQADVFNALRPIPHIEISLEGGIRLGYSNWLEGHPPRIVVYGDPKHTNDVRIDGHTAICRDGDSYWVTDWDSVGTHSIWCAGKNKSYSIIPFLTTWEHWDAYPFPISRSGNNLSICGPLVRAVIDDKQAQILSVSIPESNPLLLGQVPGEYALATRVSEIKGAPCISTSQFKPVWALPSYPLLCDKAAVDILFIGDEEALPQIDNRSTMKRYRWNNDVDKWCCQILDASRKGLRIKPDSDVVQSLWLSYKRVARQIWRARK